LCAARQGHARAQFNLGVMYASGQGVLRDLVLAHGWLQRAAGIGLATAVRYLERLVLRMDEAELSQARRIGV
jgi:TPR repeat protein